MGVPFHFILVFVSITDDNKTGWHQFLLLVPCVQEAAAPPLGEGKRSLSDEHKILPGCPHHQHPSSELVGY